MTVVSKKNIDDFLNCKIIAIAGASRNDKSFSAQVATHLRQLEYTVLLVNPNFEKNLEDGIHFRSVAELPLEVDNLLIVTPKAKTDIVMQQAVNKQIKNVWIQQSSDTPTALKMGFDKNINLIYNQCIFMFTQPEGFHKFHYSLKKFFGAVPK